MYLLFNKYYDYILNNIIENASRIKDININFLLKNISIRKFKNVSLDWFKRVGSYINVSTLTVIIRIS